MKKVKKLQEIKALNWKMKLAICILVTIINSIIIKYTLLIYEEYVENYKYAQIYSLNAVVTDSYTKLKKYSVRGTVHIEEYIDIKLENGKEVTVKVYDKDDYFKGQNITIYTNGRNYDTTETGVVDSETIPTISMITSILFIVFTVMVWTILFEVKGIVIGILVILLVVNIIV